ncbi:OmpA family protein, partial [Mesorhizobium sp. M7A.F.Ca.US.014.04.1.1]|uniref:OmpA family protein n=1 Tax=Mesorhizobium sp. M7A.F.Ca.US.014.04.1.1 TaxID=2496744 RepID=UPI001FE2264C
AEASAQRTKIEGDPAKPGDKTAETQVLKIKAVPPVAAPLEPLAKDATSKQAANPATALAGETKSDGTKAAVAKAEPEAQKAVQPDIGEKAPTAAAVKAAADVKRQLADAFKPGDKLHDGVSVEATDKGVVISITDQLDFGMFEVGSALPRRELVLAMEKIGRIVNSQKGTISINGHTDARPFRSDSYDNWRLSTARAHSAYYMLVRGGVDERRITEVAGFAATHPGPHSRRGSCRPADAGQAARDDGYAPARGECRGLQGSQEFSGPACLRHERRQPGDRRSGHVARYGGPAKPCHRQRRD